MTNNKWGYINKKFNKIKLKKCNIKLNSTYFIADKFKNIFYFYFDFLHLFNTWLKISY